MKNRGHEFESIQRGVYGKFWREERKGENDANVL